MDSIKQKMAGYKQPTTFHRPVIGKEPKYEYPPIEMSSGGMKCQGTKCVGVRPSELNVNMKK